MTFSYKENHHQQMQRGGTDKDFRGSTQQHHHPLADHINYRSPSKQAMYYTNDESMEEIEMT